MAENIPPPTPTTTTNPTAPPTTTTDSTRGLPYYEKLKRDLRSTLLKKSHLDKSLSALESSLYRHETLYLEDTAAGNIIRGFDAYIKGASTAPSGGGPASQSSTRRKQGVGEEDRVFSRSSVGWVREKSPSESPGLEDVLEGEEGGTGGGGGARVGGSSAGAGAGAAGNKKKKGGEEGEEERGPKRLKITYARGEKEKE